MKVRFGRLFVLFILLILMVMPLSAVAAEGMSVSAENTGAADSVFEDSLMVMPVAQTVSLEASNESSAEEEEFVFVPGNPVVVVVVLAVSIVAVTVVALVRKRNRECM